jgi:hypothetical protein
LWDYFKAVDFSKVKMPGGVKSLMIKINRVILLFVISLVTGCSGSSELNAQEKRNNFDLCKIEFIKQIGEKEFKSHSDYYEKQADQSCAPLLRENAPKLSDFKIPGPKKYSGPDSGNSTLRNTLTVNIQHGPWDISSDEPATSSEANRLCKNENFNYPFGERIEIFNEKGTPIGIGKVSSFISASYKSPNGTDYRLTCNYRGSVEVKGSGNFYRVKIAGTFWNDLTPIDSLGKSNWTLNLNSDDY